MVQYSMLRVAQQLPSSVGSCEVGAPKVPTKKETAEERARRCWIQADAVCFDIDSTVCRDEAIDELAAFLGVGEAVAECTSKAMGGGVRFRDALRMRLDIMRPSRAAVDEYSARNPPKLTPGIQKLVRTLHQRGTAVYLVSGGFRCLIRPVADLLDIDHKNIYANELIWDKRTGQYLTFDHDELTSDSGSKDVGKPGVLGLLKKRHGYQTVVMIGDGATDMEARPPADAFIGFGGNAIREAVRAGADWYVLSFDELIAPLLDGAATPADSSPASSSSAEEDAIDTGAKSNNSI